MPSKEMILRVAKNKTNPYVMMARAAAQDKNLSWKATGLLAYLLSLPDDWIVHMSDLATRKKDGICATRSALQELVKAGYIKKIVYRDKKTGKFLRHEYVVHESPVTHVNTTTIPVSEYWWLLNTETFSDRYNELEEKILEKDLKIAKLKAGASQ